MARTFPEDAAVPSLIEELRGLLVTEGLADPVNLHMSRHGSAVQIHIMAVDIGRLGMLLAILSDPAELSDPVSLTCRITPGGHHSTPDRWQYELIAGRYPDSQDIVFSANVRLPVTDVASVVSRLRQPS